MNVYPPKTYGMYYVQRDGGAGGLGASDDYAAFQRGFDLAPRLAGTGIDIWMEPGQYNLSSNLLVKGTTRLHGPGTNIVQLYAPNVTGALIKNNNIATVIPHPVFEGFTVNGGSSTTLTAGIDWTGMNTPVIRDVVVQAINTLNAAGFTANGSLADSSGAFLDNCGAYTIASGYGFNFQSLNGMTAAHLKGMTNRMCVMCNSITESSVIGLLTSDNTNTGDASSLKVQNCNRLNIMGLVSDDAKWINVFYNGSTNCKLIGANINDNNHAFTVGNGGLLYVAGTKHCQFLGVGLEFVFATPVAGTNGLVLDNTSAGVSQDNIFAIDINGNGAANLNAVHWVAGASGLRNRITAAISGCATYETPLETDVLGSFDSRNGIVTRGSGASTGTGAQQTIAHGLKFTPTRQQIALIPGSATAVPFHSAAPDATNIYVTAANTQPWYWATTNA